MIIILIIVISFSWLEQKFTGDHLKYGTGKGPNIGTRVIIGTYNNLGRSILSSLNFRREMMMSPATISEITDFYHHGFIQFTTSLWKNIWSCCCFIGFLSGFFLFFFLLLWLFVFVADVYIQIVNFCTLRHITYRIRWFVGASRLWFNRLINSRLLLSGLLSFPLKLLPQILLLLSGETLK